MTVAAGHTAQFAIMNDALRVGSPGDSVRLLVDGETAQTIADLFGAVLPTAKLLDSVAVQASIFIDANESIPGTQKPDGGPYKTTAKMIEHSAKLDTFTDGETFELVGGGWKDWINSSRLLAPQLLKLGKNSAINYGYFTTSAAVAPPDPGPRPSMTEPSLRVIQQPGAAHTVKHVDVSQKLRLVGRAVFVQGPLFPDGEWLDIDKVALHPILWPLVNHAGPLKLHHPWLPTCSSMAEGGECPGGPPSGPPAKPPPVSAAGFTWERLAPLAAIVLPIATYYAVKGLTI